MIILVNIIIMFSSFFIAYFVNNITTIVNRNLILNNSMSLLLTLNRISFFYSYLQVLVSAALYNL